MQQSQRLPNGAMHLPVLWNYCLQMCIRDRSIFINGSYGNKVMNLTKRNLTTMSSPWANQHADVLNRAQLEPIDPSFLPPQAVITTSKTTNKKYICFI